MDSALYPHTVRPVSAGEIVRAARGRLAGERGPYDANAARARDAFGGDLGVRGRVLAHSEDSDTAPPYAVVLQRRDAGGVATADTGARRVVVIVRIESRSGRSGWDAWHDVMHQHAHAMLQGFWPKLEAADVRAGFGEVSPADTALLDADDDTRYSASAYALLAVPSGLADL